MSVLSVALPVPLCRDKADAGKDQAQGLHDADAGCWFGKAATAAKLEKWQCLSVNAHGSSRHWKSTDISKQWDIMIQKCEMQGGVLPGLKPSRNSVVSGLRDPKETFISVTKIAFMCPSFGRTLEKIWVFHRVWQIEQLL